MKSLTERDLLERESGLNQATRLFQSGEMSIGKAAKLAGMPFVAFTEHVSRLGISVVDYDPDELNAELDFFKT